MAIAETGAREKIDFVNSTTKNITVPADCTLVIVAGGWWDNAQVHQITALSIDGDGFTKVTSQENAADEMATDIWRLVNPSTGAQTLTITCSGALTDDWAGFVVYYKGVDTASPIRNSDSEWETNYGADPFATAAISSAVGDLMFCLVGSYVSDADAAPAGKGQTEVDNHSKDFSYVAFGTKAGAAPSVIMWGSGASGGISAISIKPSVTGQTVLPSGISSLEAFGTPQLNLRMFPSSIASLEAFGSHLIYNSDQYILPSGIVSLETFGTPVLGLYITPTGIASFEAFGTPTLGLYILPPGITSAEAFGTTIIYNLDQYILPSSIASLEAFGTPFISLGAQYVLPSAIVSLEAFGTPQLNLRLLPSSIASAEAFGTTIIYNSDQYILPSGIVSAEAIGSHLIYNSDQYILPSAIASLEAFGTAVVSVSVQYILPSGIISLEAFGMPQLNLRLFPSSIISAETFGTPQLNFRIYPASILSAEAFGSTLIYLSDQYILPNGITSLEDFGTLFIYIPTGIIPEFFKLEPRERIYKLVARDRIIKLKPSDGIKEKEN